MNRRWFNQGGSAALLCLIAVMSVAVEDTGAATAPRLPRLLSESGLYSDPGRLIVDVANRPYAPQYPLWTDGATKKRWIRLPEGSAIDASAIDAWEFPVGTRFWKEFAFAGRRVETRMLMKVAPDRWTFASYVWNAQQTDAELAPSEGVPDAFDLAGGKRHSIPSIDDCRACHESNRVEPLGFTALQLSDDRDPLAPHAEPPGEGLTLTGLRRERLLMNAPAELFETSPHIPATTPRARAALGYLSANCGACHNTLGSLASLGLTFRQPAFGGGLDVVRAGLARRTKWDRPGAVPETTRVVDRDAPELSALLLRMKSRRPLSQMPPLGSVLPDHDAITLVTGWILESE